MNILTQADNTDKDQWTRDRRSIDFNEPLNTVENDFFWISQGKVATSDRLGGQICKTFMFNFLRN